MKKHHAFSLKKKISNKEAYQRNALQYLSDKLSGLSVDMFFSCNCKLKASHFAHELYVSPKIIWYLFTAPKYIAKLKI